MKEENLDHRKGEKEGKRRRWSEGDEAKRSREKSGNTRKAEVERPAQSWMKRMVD